MHFKSQCLRKAKGGRANDGGFRPSSIPIGHLGFPSLFFSRRSNTEWSIILCITSRSAGHSPVASHHPQINARAIHNTSLQKRSDFPSDYG